MRDVTISVSPSREVLQALLKHPGLKKINLAAGVPEEESDVLRQIFAKMEEIRIHETSVSPGAGHAIEYVVDTVPLRANKLKKLFFNVTIIYLDPVLSSTSLNKIEVLEVELTEEQANQVTFSYLLP